MNEQLKTLAVNRLKVLNVYAPYVRSFSASKQVVTLFENGIGYYAVASNGYAEEEKIIKEVESKVNGIVYAIIRSHTSMGQMDSYLYVTEDDLEDEMYMEGSTAYVYADVYSDACYGDEMGEIGVRGMWGGLVRVA